MNCHVADGAICIKVARCVVEDTLCPPVSYLVTDVQSKDDGEHASGRVATVMLGPMVINILEKHWVHHQNLHIQSERDCCQGNT